MDKKYITLFKTLAQATAISAEKVMEYDRKNDDQSGLEAATTMRDDYQELVSIIKKAGDDYVPNRVEAARLLIGVMVQMNQLQTQLNTIQSAMTGYQSDVIPKLQEIVDKAESDDAARQMANEKFIIVENDK